MDENMNGNQQNGMNAGQPDGAAQNMNPDQQAYGGQQYYDPNQQAYGGQYGQQPQGNKPADSGFDKVKNAIVNNKKIVIIAAAAVVALILIFNIIGGIAGHGKQSPKAVVKAYVNAVEKQSGKKLYKLIDKKVLKYTKDEEDMDKDEMIDKLDQILELSGDYLEDEVGKVKSMKVKFKKVKKLKGSKLEDKQEDYEDEYDIKVSQVARVEGTIKVKGKDDDIEEDFTMYVYKRGGKWYLDFSSVY